MTDVFKFLLNQETLEGTVLEKILEEKAQRDAKGAESYKRKYTGMDLFRNRNMYTEEQLQRSQDQLKKVLFYFGYTDNPEEDESNNTNPDNFYHFKKEDISPELAKTFN